MKELLIKKKKKTKQVKGTKCKKPADYQWEMMGWGEGAVKVERNRRYDERTFFYCVSLV